MTRTFILFSVVIFSLTGCYKLESPPFADKDLKMIGATEFGKDVVKAVGKISPEKGSPIGQMIESLSGTSKALVINDEFLVMQEKKEGSWQLTVLMKNSSHIMFCTLIDNENIQVPNSIKVTKKKEMMGIKNSVRGPSEELKKFALELVETSRKICFGVPFKSSKMEKTTEYWWKFWK